MEEAIENEVVASEVISTGDAIDKAFDDLENSSSEDNDSSAVVESVVEGEVSKEQSSEAKIQSNSEPLAAPVDLSEGAKAKFYAMDRNGQELFLERYKDLQGDYTRKTQEFAAKRREADQLDQVFGEYEPDLVASGQSKPEVVGNFLRWNNLLNKDPVRGLYKLAEVLGVNLGAPQQRTQEQSSYDPARTALDQRIASIESKFQATENQVYQQQLQSQLLGLAEEKDSSGNAVRPMFQELVQPIQGFLAILAQDPENEGKSEIELVDLAYRKAYEPYKKLRSAEIQKQVTKSKSAALASSSISSSVSRGEPTKPKVKNTGDAVDRAFEEMGI